MRENTNICFLQSYEYIVQYKLMEQLEQENFRY